MNNIDKYCISISNKISLEAILEKIDENNFIEYRLDRDYSLNDIKTIIANYNCIIAPKIFKRDDYNKFLKIIDLKPEYVDIDYAVFGELSHQIINYSQFRNVKTILSFHSIDINETVLGFRSKINEMKSFDPDLIKYVFINEDINFIEQAFEIYNEFDKNKLILFGSGKCLKHTRSKALQNGSPFMYIYFEDFGPTADGQYSNLEINNQRV